jgi:phage terminase small subunit
VKIGKKGKQNPVKVIPIPAQLSARARGLWDEIVPRRIRSPEQLALLEVALRAFDRANQARSILESAGIVVTSQRSGLQHEHPAVKIEHRTRAQFLRAWKVLRLHKGAWTYGYPS